MSFYLLTFECELVYQDQELAGTTEIQGSGGTRGFWTSLWVMAGLWEKGLSRMQSNENSGESSQVRDLRHGF